MLVSSPAFMSSLSILAVIKSYSNCVNIYKTLIAFHLAGMNQACFDGVVSLSVECVYTQTYGTWNGEHLTDEAHNLNTLKNISCC